MKDILIDNLGRRIEYLRISLTHKCNFDCIYCSTTHRSDLNIEELLTFEEIVRIIQILSSRGVKKVRFTGGEPLLRKGIEELIRLVKNETEVEEIHLTTNGYFLSRMAKGLKRAGLDRINISIDSIDRETFARITRSDSLHIVLEGLKSAIEEGFSPIKINTVLLRGFNDSRIVEFIEFFLKYDSPLMIRFIEYMTFEGSDRSLSFFDTSSVFSLLSRRFLLKPEKKMPLSGPAIYYRIVDTPHMVGFISPNTRHFCSECNRIRISPEGEVRGCLRFRGNISIRSYLRSGKSNEEISEILANVIMNRPSILKEGDFINSDDSNLPIYEGEMRSIGG